MFSAPFSRLSGIQLPQFLPFFMDTEGNILPRGESGNIIHILRVLSVCLMIHTDYTTILVICVTFGKLAFS